MERTFNRLPDDESQQNEDAVATEIGELLSRVLALDDIMPDANFFELGGDSLTAMELMLAIEKRFSISIDPIELFQRPSLRDFAALVTQVREQQSEQR